MTQYIRGKVKYVADVVAMFAGGLNHTGCCVSDSVPGDCLSLCSGSDTSSPVNAACLSYVHVIASCLQQALGMFLSYRAYKLFIVISVCAHF